MRKLLREPFFLYSVVCWLFIIVLLIVDAFLGDMTSAFFWISTLWFEIR